MHCETQGKLGTQQSSINAQRSAISCECTVKPKVSDWVGAEVCDSVGAEVGDGVGPVVGDSVGAEVGHSGQAVLTILLEPNWLEPKWLRINVRLV